MLSLISDIHGNLKGFKKMLDKIAFDAEKDNMIILGDVLDRGSDGIELLEYIKPLINNGSVELLLGNHELFSIMYLEGELDRSTWSAFGGKDTLESIKKMTKEQRQELLLFLKGLPIYSEIYSKYLGNVICTHTGLDADHLAENADGSINVKKSIEEAYKVNRYNYMVGMDLHYLAAKDKKALDSFLIVGHVPCRRLNENMSNRFVRTPYYIDIDAGSGHDEGVLGCYIVDTDEEIYV